MDLAANALDSVMYELSNRMALIAEVFESVSAQLTQLINGVDFRRLDELKGEIRQLETAIDASAGIGLADLFSAIEETSSNLRSVTFPAQQTLGQVIQPPASIGQNISQDLSASQEQMQPSVTVISNSIGKVSKTETGINRPLETPRLAWGSEPVAGGIFPTGFEQIALALASANPLGVATERERIEIPKSSSQDDLAGVGSIKERIDALGDFLAEEFLGSLETRLERRLMLFGRSICADLNNTIGDRIERLR